MHCGPYVGCAGGSPTLDAEAEMSEAEFERLKYISASDRVHREMVVLCDVLYYAGTYDQQS